VVAGYGLTSAAFLVTGGRLGDHFGRRRAFCAGIAAFTVTSALCAAAPDPGFLVAARLAQGIGAAVMAPNVLSILGTTYTGPARVKAVSVYGIVMGVAAAGGQLLGGLLIAANVAGLGWRVIFWVNVPVGVAAVLLALYLQEGRGLSPIESGEVFAVLAAGYLATSLRAPALTMRFGRRVVATGALLAALGDVALVLAVLSGGAGDSVPVAALFPGLFLLGGGQGLCITPLTTTVLAHADASRAGSVSGALSTAQQVGNAIGVAVSGVIFYGLLTDGRGYSVAYRWSTAEMALLLAGVAALAFLIPPVQNVQKKA
jgi:MFS family permease